MPHRPEIDVAYVARLARLHLTAAETELFETQLGKVLEYANQLQKLNLSGGVPDDAEISSALRRDEARPSLSAEEALQNAPRSSRGLFIVPRAIE
jgi:aspartyl-tRNA(Asn)/glutamyl-tRNA(Gln) amidotransferase subunit C